MVKSNIQNRIFDKSILLSKPLILTEDCAILRDDCLSCVISMSVSVHTRKMSNSDHTLADWKPHTRDLSIKRRILQAEPWC